MGGGKKRVFDRGNDRLCAAGAMEGSHLPLSLEVCPEATGDPAKSPPCVTLDGWEGRAFRVGGATDGVQDLGQGERKADHTLRSRGEACTR